LSSTRQCRLMNSFPCRKLQLHLAAHSHSIRKALVAVTFRCMQWSIRRCSVKSPIPPDRPP
jgi:hypothetical protein